MSNGTWKTIAIIFMVAFFSLFGFLMWGLILNDQYEEDTYHCYYDVCGEYVDALYEEPICFCYEYDVMGNLQIGHEEYIR